MPADKVEITTELELEVGPEDVNEIFCIFYKTLMDENFLLTRVTSDEEAGKIFKII